jgi:hypothetical protein
VSSRKWTKWVSDVPVGPGSTSRFAASRRAFFYHFESHLKACADDDRDCDTSTPLDEAHLLEMKFGTVVVGTAKGDNAPVHIHVDDDTSAFQRARTLEHVSTTAAEAQWQCEHATVAQVILLTLSSIQLYLGLIASYGVISILAVVASILGLASSIQYFTGDVRSLEETLNWVQLPPVLPFLMATGQAFILLSPSFILDSRVALCSVRCGRAVGIAYTFICREMKLSFFRGRSL